MKQWEYKVEKDLPEQMNEMELNAYGNKGWELIDFTVISYNSAITYNYVFKRQQTDHEAILGIPRMQKNISELLENMGDRPLSNKDKN